MGPVLYLHSYTLCDEIINIHNYITNSGHLSIGLNKSNHFHGHRCVKLST